MNFLFFFAHKTFKFGLVKLGTTLNFTSPTPTILTMAANTSTNPFASTRKAGLQYISVPVNERVARPVSCRNCVAVLLKDLGTSHREADACRRYRVSCTDRGESLPTPLTSFTLSEKRSNMDANL